MALDESPQTPQSACASHRNGLELAIAGHIRPTGAIPAPPANIKKNMRIKKRED